MATKETETPANLDRLNENLARIEELSQRLVSALATKKPKHPGLEGPGLPEMPGMKAVLGIPMEPGTDSLNGALAAGIALYAWRRSLIPS